MAVGAHALTTLARVRAVLRMHSGYTAQDAAIESAIDSATARIEQFTNRSAVKNVDDGNVISVTEVHSGDGETPDLYLGEWPAYSITGVIEDDTTISANADDGYWKSIGSDQEEGILYRVDQIETTGFTHPKGTKPWAFGEKNIRVVYKPGWVAADVPAVFDEACMRLTMHYLNTVPLAGMKSASAGALRHDLFVGWGTSLITMPIEVKAILKDYIVHRVVDEYPMRPRGSTKLWTAKQS